MKRLFVYFLVLIFVSMFIPLSLSLIFDSDDKAYETGKTIKVYDTKNDEIISMGLETYLIGVVSAEMPVSFETEALKAQSVAARTYALRKISQPATHENGANICTDFAHCQAYQNTEELKEKWGRDYDKNIKKIKTSVKETSSQFLSYNGDYASTVFHASSNGKTEASEDVWSKPYPYLSSVDSGENFTVKDFKSEVSLKKEEFINGLNSILETNKFKSEDELKITDYTYTKGNNVKSLQVSGVEFNAKDFREKFKLKSTAFKIKSEKDEIVFEVTGNGHGVGMSQYGAHYMALEGRGYKEILFHFYPGTEIKEYK